MRIFKTLPLSIPVFLIGVSSQPALAEFSVSGYGGFGMDYDVYEDDLRIDRLALGEVLIGYNANALGFGVGYSGEYNLEDKEFDSGGLLYYLGNENIRLTYGSLWGAGNIFPEDFFDMNDSTSSEDKNLRLDFALGNHRFAVSAEGEEDAKGDYEIGYRGNFPGLNGDPMALVVGYESDGPDLGVAVAQKFGDWTIIASALNDLERDGTNDQTSLTVGRAITQSISVAASYSLNGDGDPAAHGALINFKFDNVLAKIEFVKQLDSTSSRGNGTLWEAGFIVPFGAKHKTDQSRFALKEYKTDFGFFETELP